MSPETATDAAADTASQSSVLTVSLGERSYPIHIGPGLLGRAGALIAPLLRKPRVFVVTDATVAALHLDALLASLGAAGIAHDHVVLPAGEATKSFSQLEELLDLLLAARFERSTTLLALGGGVIGDLVGFAAAILLRGVDFIQIPTTLLAQVDSSVGGKTGINTAYGKNLVGAFHQPRLVLADTTVLDTLPRRELLAGYGEVVKYGVIDDPAFFDWLEEHGSALIAGDGAARIHAVLTACRAKARVVAEDEREGGRRALLNLGHTFGHALEAETGFGPTLLHGEAVALGMVMALDLSVRLGLCPPADAVRLRAHLDHVGLPTDPRRLEGAPAWNAERLLAAMDHDKKVEDGKVTFVLARGIGRSLLWREADTASVLATLRAAVAP
ncbi:3-dehydroquinate synthase [Rhodospirillum rubrum]|uniref:3-dehydroquinate synthase n=1 Tax=Rhodospirillum rubrum TaxID=1085 RepID=UPI0019034146|nr:3-dehydroquinate synthase [Rhodospirillum rubrum]MBK1665752.1 3-dehydroquinate synthase [Rhodospirillum rubrum]MBK1678045.1 3-dehydroquinate synthase [Rhodospirillum rubrum]